MKYDEMSIDVLKAHGINLFGTYMSNKTIGGIDVYIDNESDNSDCIDNIGSMWFAFDCLKAIECAYVNLGVLPSIGESISSYYDDVCVYKITDKIHEIRTNDLFGKMNYSIKYVIKQQ